MGKDRGAIPVLESSMLPHATDAVGQTTVFAHYTDSQDAGHGVGALLTALPSLLLILDRVPGDGLVAVPRRTDRVLAAPLYLLLSPALEVHAEAVAVPVSPEGRRTIARLSALFSLDAIGGGFLTEAAMAYLFGGIPTLALKGKTEILRVPVK